MKGFKRVYKKTIKNNDELKNRFWDAMDSFQKILYNSQLRTHKLTGKLEGLWAFSIAFNCRVIFKFLEKDEVLLIDIGGHDEVY